MKKILILSMFLSWQFITAQTHEKASLHWYTDFEQAKAVAQKEHKPILMLFTGSDWCPPCRLMHNELFEDHDFQKIAKKAVLVLVDFPRRKPISAQQRKQNALLQQKFHRGGVPTFVAISPDESFLGKMSGYGYGTQNRYIDFFKAMIAKNKKK